jgi:ArsR family transcriptional regulator
MSNLAVVDGCCAPLATEALSSESAAQLAPRFKALGDPARLRLLSLIASSDSGEVCVCDLAGAFALSPPTISHHLKVLRQAGLVTSQRRGTWVYYSPNRSALASIGSILATAGDVRAVERGPVSQRR